MHSLSVRTCGHSLAAYPHPITKKTVRGDVAKLPYLGEKILSMVSARFNFRSPFRTQSLDRGVC